jgi:hypothetical protein
MIGSSEHQDSNGHCQSNMIHPLPLAQDGLDVHLFIVSKRLRPVPNNRRLIPGRPRVFLPSVAVSINVFSDLFPVS